MTEQAGGGGFDWGNFAGSMAGSSAQGFGGIADRAAARKRGHENLDMSQAIDFLNYNRQKEFAKNSIQWRVEDAERAGIHPLYALGGSSAMYNPGSIAVGDSGGSGSTFENMGQDISRAIRSGMDSSERRAADLQMKLLESQIAETDMRKLEIQDRLKRREAEDNVTGPWPAGAGKVQVQPVQKFSQSLEDPSKVAGDHALYADVWIDRKHKIRLPYSPGENPLESLEGFWPGAITLYGNVANKYYDKEEELRKGKLKWLYDASKGWREINRRAERWERRGAARKWR